MILFLAAELIVVAGLFNKLRGDISSTEIVLCVIILLDGSAKWSC